VRHFYHAWADGTWDAPLLQHLHALAAAGLDVTVEAGIAGAPARRRAVTRVLAASGLRYRVVAEADAGFQGVTLSALHAHAHCMAPGEPVLYAHTKGATAPGDELRHRWREGMTAVVVGQWRRCAAALASHDVAGAHWREPPRQLAAGRARAQGRALLPHFPGNFWWARAGYLATLPVPAAPRYEAETWIGLGSPRAASVRPGPHGRTGG
jgi:hypothetical protein